MDDLTDSEAPEQAGVVLCGYCHVEMRPLPSGSLVCPTCWRWAAKDQKPPAPPTP